jgi:hypothetical protein
MQFARIVNGTVSAVGDYRSLFPQTSFSVNGPDAAFIEANSLKVVTYSKPYNSETEKLTPVPPYLENGEVFAVVVEQLTQEEIQGINNFKAANIRNQRNKLLAACDWTQLADSTADKPTWATYRQALRDVPSQENFPNSVTWPTPPSATPDVI